MSGEIQEGGNRPSGLPEGRLGRRSARARRVLSQPVDTQTSPIVPRGPEAETSEPLAPVQEALEQAHRNLVVWHDSLMDSNPQLFKRGGGLLPVVSNGRTINYKVAADPASKHQDKDIIWPLGEPTDRISIRTTDPKLKGRPRSVVVSYEPGRIGQTEAIRSVEVNWNDPDGLTGEAIVCFQGRIDFILKTGKNGVYFKSPFYKKIKDATGSDNFFQDMGLQFVYDQQGKLQHQYARLANWDCVLFYFADGKPWTKGMFLPDFPVKSHIWKDSRFPVEKTSEGIADKNSVNLERILSGSIREEYYFNPGTAKWGNVFPINRTSEDGSRLSFTHLVFSDIEKDPKGEPVYYAMELPTTFDAIPHVQSAFPATFSGVTPLLHGEFGRRLHLEITGPKTKAQEYLRSMVQDLTREGAAWKGVTADDLKEAHQFLTQKEVLAEILRCVTDPSDPYRLQTVERINEIIDRTVSLGFLVDRIKAVVRHLDLKDLDRPGIFEKLATAHRVYGLTTDNLRWVIDTIFQGQTELVLRSEEKGGFLPDLHRLQASVVNRLPRRGNGRAGKTQEQGPVDAEYTVVPEQPETAGTELAIRPVEQNLRLGEAATVDDRQYIRRLTEAYRTLLISERLYKRGPVALEDDSEEAGRWAPKTEAELATWGLNPGSLVFVDKVLARLDHPDLGNGQLVMDVLSSQPRTEKGPTDPILLVKAPSKLDPQKWHPYEVIIRLFPEGIPESMFFNNGLASWWRNIARPVYRPATQLATDGSFERERTNLKLVKGISAKERAIVAAAAKLCNRKVLSGEPVDMPSVRALNGKPHQWWQVSYGTPFAPTISPTRIVSASTEINPAIPCDLKDPQLQIVELDLTTQQVTVSTYKYQGWAKFLTERGVECQRVEYSIGDYVGSSSILGGWLIPAKRGHEALGFTEFAKRWFTIPIRDFTS